MVTEYFLFPDRREPVRVHLRGNTSLESAQFLSFLAREDWEYPVLALTRESGDNRWSHTMLVPRMRNDAEPHPD